ncbi:MAG TPA: TrmH family RNA methyltransferase, partial [Planctomycetota bacterium]|nr:TrmH family RNA methyltransferase [Planctomycetota bacterium]
MSDVPASSESITSPQNPRVKFWVELRKNGQARRDAGLYQLEGLRAVESLAAQTSGAPAQQIDTLIVSWKELERQSPEALARAQAVAAQVTAAGGHLVEVTRDVFHKIADVETPQGIMAIAKIPQVAVAELVATLAENKSLAIAGVNVNDPGNLGTLLRSAAAFGADALFALEGSVDPFHPKVLRASAGNRLPVARGPWAEFREACRTHKVRVIGVALPLPGQPAAPLDKLKVKKSEAIVLCVGGEANGFPENA